MNDTRLSVRSRLHRLTPSELSIIAALSGADDEDGWMSRAEIRERSGAGAATISRAKAVLARRGLAEYGTFMDQARPGRPAGYLRLLKDQALTGGIVVDGDTIHASVRSFNSEVVSSWTGKSGSGPGGRRRRDVERCLKTWAGEGVALEKLVTVTLAAGCNDEGRVLGTGLDPAELEAEFRAEGWPVRVDTLAGAISDTGARAGLVGPGKVAFCVWLGRILQAGAVLGPGHEGRWTVHPAVGPPPTTGLADLKQRLKAAGHAASADPADWDDGVWKAPALETWIADLGEWLARAAAHGSPPRAADAIVMTEPASHKLLSLVTPQIKVHGDMFTDGDVPPIHSLDPIGGLGGLAAAAGLHQLSLLAKGPAAG